MPPCPWGSAYASASSPAYQSYHDEEWGRPVTDDRLLYEMMVLELNQAGLSWATILAKRGYVLPREKMSM